MNDAGLISARPYFAKPFVAKLPQSSSHYPASPPPVRVRLTVTPEHACSYFPDRAAQTRAIWAEQIPPELYHQFMDAGFRRSGKVLYQPVCRRCRACQPIRVPVATFRTSKSQRRAVGRNADLAIMWAAPKATDEKFDLYRRYVVGWHRKSEGDEDRASFESFLYDSPVQTIEYSYRNREGRLLAVGICDVCDESLSSVYFYFDPEEAGRGLGTFGMLFEIEEARRLGIPHYYLGYWIDGCQTMQYKNNLRPNEILSGDGVWRSQPTP